jgi:hypothetical protein
MIDKIHAIVSLVPNAEVVVRDNDIVEWINPSVAPITDAEIQAEIARLQADYNAKQYQRNRAKEYPSIVDQLDTLYHGGYDAWKASIQAIKNKYPKGAA